MNTISLRHVELITGVAAVILGIAGYFTRSGPVEFFAVLAAVAALTLIVSRMLK